MAPPESETPASPRRSRRLLLMISLPLALLIGAGIYWWSLQGKVSTDNAYVQQDKVSIGAEVGGKIVEVFVKDGQDVAGGDLLFRIDPEPYRLQIGQADAEIAMAQANVTALASSADLSGSDIAAAREDIAFNQATLQRQQAFFGGLEPQRLVARIDDLAQRLFLRRDLAVHLPDRHLQRQRPDQQRAQCGNTHADRHQHRLLPVLAQRFRHALAARRAPGAIRERVRHRLRHRVGRLQAGAAPEFVPVLQRRHRWPPVRRHQDVVAPDPAFMPGIQRHQLLTVRKRLPAEQGFGEDAARRRSDLFVAHCLRPRPRPDHRAVAGPFDMRLRIRERRPARDRHVDEPAPLACRYRGAVEHRVGAEAPRQHPFLPVAAFGELLETVSPSQPPAWRKAASEPGTQRHPKRWLGIG